MQPDDVLRDLKNARIMQRRVTVSRSEENGRIRWVIEIEGTPWQSRFGKTLRIFDSDVIKPADAGDSNISGEERR
ncbi:MAG: hypothetical protein ABSA92_14850 [Candidatus Bathyarchaeia archaeon]|jgi:hypothetical protein